MRAAVLAPGRLNAFVFTGFAGIARLIAVGGLAGVLAFSFSGRLRGRASRVDVVEAPRSV